MLDFTGVTSNDFVFFIILMCFFLQFGTGIPDTQLNIHGYLESKLFENRGKSGGNSASQC